MQEDRKRYKLQYAAPTHFERLKITMKKNQNTLQNEQTSID